MTLPITQGRREAYLPTFDGWRGIAILIVVISHSIYNLNYICLTGLFRGDLGVNLFFALSGFLITRLILREYSVSQQFHFSSFWIKRLFRIVPILYLYLLFCAILQALGFVRLGPPSYLASIFFLRNWIADNTNTVFYTGHLWSLGIEMQFYLFWPAILWLLRFKRVFGASVAIGFAFAAWRYYDFHHVSWITLHLNRFHLHSHYYSRTDIRGDCLVWGAAAGAWYHSHSSTAHLNPLLRPLLIPVWGSLYLICAFFKVPFHLTWEPALLALLITTTTVNSGHRFARWLEARWLVWIGRISYSLYVWQQIFFPPNSCAKIYLPLQSFPLNLCLCFLTGWVSYRWLEQPLSVFGARLAKKRTPCSVSRPISL